MDPITARMLSQAHISELHAEGAANRMAAAAHKKSRVESPCRIEAVGRKPRVELPQVDCSWFERLWATIRRAIPARAA